MSLPHLLIAIKSAVSFPTDLTLAGHHVWKGQASETLWRNDVLEFSKMCKPPLGNLVSLLRTGGATYTITKRVCCNVAGIRLLLLIR